MTAEALVCLQDQGIDNNDRGFGRECRACGLSDDDIGVGRERRIHDAPVGSETTTEAEGARQQDR